MRILLALSQSNLILIYQARPAVVKVKDTGFQQRVAINRARKLERFYQSGVLSTGDQIINITDMYIRNGGFLFT